MIYWSDLYAWNAPLGFSNYQALQIQLNKRFSKGLQFLSNYSFSKNLGNISSAFGDTWGMNYGRPMDYYNLKLEKSVLEFDQTHVVKIGASYDLPVGTEPAASAGRCRAPWISSPAAGRCSISAITRAARRSVSARPARRTRISLPIARSSSTRAGRRW